MEDIEGGANTQGNSDDQELQEHIQKNLQPDVLGKQGFSGLEQHDHSEAVRKALSGDFDEESERARLIDVDSQTTSRLHNDRSSRGIERRLENRYILRQEPKPGESIFSQEERDRLREIGSRRAQRFFDELSLAATNEVMEGARSILDKIMGSGTIPDTIDEKPDETPNPELHSGTSDSSEQPQS